MSRPELPSLELLNELEARYSDPDVRELVTFMRYLHEGAGTELAFENAYDPPRPLSYQDLRDQDWLQANLARNLRLVKRRTIVYQTSWENASEDDLPNGS